MSEGFEIRNLKLRNFRNYESVEKNFESGLNKIVGANATGKTNIIEAIGLLTQISSFRASQISDLVNKNCGDLPAQISAEIFDANTDTNFQISMDIANGKKSYKLNGKAKSISSLKGKFPSVIFTPDDLAFVKGSNTIRRNAIDNLGAQISPDYYNVMRDYAKVLKQKNALLRDGANLDMLKSINDVMLISGAQLVFYRVALVQKIAPVISDFYSKIAGAVENLKIEYYPSWAMDDKLDSISRDNARQLLNDCFEQKLLEEKSRCRALTGPHRDRITFVLNDSDAQNFASQGQQRSIVLAFKFTEVHLIESLLDKRPILLLDDVMSELDTSRQEKLTHFINSQTQTFLTTTRP